VIHRHAVDRVAEVFALAADLFFHHLPMGIEDLALRFEHEVHGAFSLSARAFLRLPLRAVSPP
jgi:hypothetical protein